MYQVLWHIYDRKTGGIINFEVEAHSGPLGNADVTIGILAAKHESKHPEKRYICQQIIPVPEAERP